jgi:monoamine oxidase
VNCNNIENLEDQETFEKQVTTLAMISLRSMFGNSIKDPEKVVVTKWNTDKYSLGTYSFNKVSMDKKCRTQLAKPIMKQRVYITGEATSFRHFGTTHGAYYEGVKTALKVIRALDNSIDT